VPRWERSTVRAAEKRRCRGRDRQKASDGEERPEPKNWTEDWGGGRLALMAAWQ
jgi:hypothetical protein